MTLGILAKYMESELQGLFLIYLFSLSSILVTFFFSQSVF